MKAQLSIEALITLSLFIVVLAAVLIKLSFIVADYHKISEENVALYAAINRSEQVVGDWVITNFSCPNFYVKIGNFTCGTPGNTLVDRHALCNGSICEVIVG